jgi:hypothetical protein
MSGRWEDDDRGRGIADAAQLVAGASELVAAFGESMWVAEGPENHLRPRIEEWCRRDSRLQLIEAQTDEQHAYVVELRWLAEPASVGQARAVVFSLIGAFAESATYVRQRRVNRDVEGEMKLLFEVGTGELASDARFDPHGHTVVIGVTGVG